MEHPVWLSWKGLCPLPWLIHSAAPKMAYIRSSVYPSWKKVQRSVLKATHVKWSKTILRPAKRQQSLNNPVRWLYQSKSYDPIKTPCNLPTTSFRRMAGSQKRWQRISCHVPIWSTPKHQSTRFHTGWFWQLQVAGFKGLQTSLSFWDSLPKSMKTFWIDMFLLNCLGLLRSVALVIHCILASNSDSSKQDPFSV